MRKNPKFKMFDFNNVCVCMCVTSCFILLVPCLVCIQFCFFCLVSQIQFTCVPRCVPVCWLPRVYLSFTSVPCCDLFSCYVLVCLSMLVFPVSVLQLCSALCFVKAARKVVIWVHVCLQSPAFTSTSCLPHNWPMTCNYEQVTNKLLT